MAKYESMKQLRKVKGGLQKEFKQLLDKVNKQISTKT